MRRYSFQLRAPKPAPVAQPVEAEEPTVDSDDVSYRDLQARAKELDIPANQSREDLESAIAEAEQ